MARDGAMDTNVFIYLKKQPQTIVERGHGENAFTDKLFAIALGLGRERGNGDCAARIARYNVKHCGGRAVRIQRRYDQVVHAKHIG
jgi:hypothetical protein